MRGEDMRGNVNGVVELAGVTVRRDGRRLLSDVTWRTSRGEHWALLGANGAGKTTLLQLVLGYQWPTQGTVHVLGQRYGACDVREVRTRIGFVSSSMEARLDGSQSAREVVATGADASFAVYGPMGAVRSERAQDLLRDFFLERFAEHPFVTLSQGERQKVMIARALMAQPELLVLDEPCVGLDFAARARLLLALDRICATEGSPQVLYVTHYPEEIFSGITHVGVLHSGQLIAAGEKRSTLTPAVFGEAYGVAVDVRWDGGAPLVRTLAQGRGE